MNIIKSSIISVFMEIDGVERKVGRLAYVDKHIHFEYDKNFLALGIHISPFILPLQEMPIKCTDKTFDGLFGVFADSLPDGWGRLLLDRHARKIGINPYDLTPLDRLLLVGPYGMGAFRYEPDQSIDVGDPKNITLDDVAKYSRDILDSDTDNMIEALIALNGSSSGARPKAMIQVNSDKTNIINDDGFLHDNHVHWMVKFPSSSDGKEAGAIEYTYSLMAKSAGLKMPETHLFRTEKGAYFACERFDRNGDNKIHTHTLAGLIHADFRHPSLDYDDILTVTMELTRDYREMEDVYRLACFNVLSKNKDDHAKNFSFILLNGEWKFSPPYDLTFSSGPNGEHSMSVMGNGRDPCVKDLLGLADAHSIKNGLSIILDVINSLQRWKEFAEDVNISKGTIKMISDAINIDKVVASVDFQLGDNIFRDDKTINDTDCFSTFKSVNHSRPKEVGAS